ncbi:MAG: class I SAM-dependent methyltransferase [Myxococcales bacterium]|nr:class I SAM-dependent methyltransferase [Myxococcales bacterium]
MTANRAAKNLKHWQKRLAREKTTVFRLFDQDIPEVRVVIDWYDGDLVFAEYEREQTSTVPQYLESLGAAVAEALGVDASRCHYKRRHTRHEGDTAGRYGASGQRAEKIVHESGHRFSVDLASHIDTGLFADHRPTRQWVAREARGKRFLNLYGYTGSFTVYAAAAGARETVTVDRSRQYLERAHHNMALNALLGSQHRFEARDCLAFLNEARLSGARYDLIVLDPPSFSTAGEDPELEVLRDHRRMVEAALATLEVEGQLWFSTNHQRFEPDLERLGLREVTDKTVAPEYRNRNAHRAWWTRR